MKNVLFVCLGNICRSPLAEALFNKRIAEANLGEEFCADSAGTSAYHLGDPPDQRSVINARENGVTINHRARQFTIDDFANFHYILAMDRQNIHNIQALARKHTIRHQGVFLFRSFQHNPMDLEVPDPYFGGQEGFQNVFDILDDCNINFIKHLKNNAN